MTVRICAAMALMLLTPALWAQQALPQAPRSPDADEFVEPNFGSLFVPGRMDTLVVQQVLPAPDFLADTEVASLFTTLRRVELQGATVMARELREIAREYVDRPLSGADLRQLRHRLSLAYLNAGYVNFNVVMPDQDLSQGVLVLNVVEGQLAHVVVDSPRGLSEDWVRQRLAPELRQPLRVSEVQQAIQLLQSDPRVHRVDAHLRPMPTPGHTALDVVVTPGLLRRLRLAADNHRTESVGANRVSLSLEHLSLTGRGDQLRLVLGSSDGSRTGSALWRLPIGAGQTELELYADRTDADIVEKAFKDLDISSRTDSLRLQIRHHLLRGLQQSLALSAGLELRESRTTLLGEGFSLSPGADNGDTRVAVALFGLDTLWRTDHDVLALGATLRVGRDMLGAKADDNPLTNRTGATTRFETLVLQASYLRKVGEHLQLTLRGAVQRSGDSLLALEKRALGGVNTVRGVRENLLVRDNTAFVNAGLDIDLVWQAAPWLRGLTLSPFVDWGQAQDVQDAALLSRNRDTSRRRWLVTAGLGMRWVPRDGLVLEMWWGEEVANNFTRFDDPRRATQVSGLQGDGVHAAASWQWAF